MLSQWLDNCAPEKAQAAKCHATHCDDDADDVDDGNNDGDDDSAGEEF